jgi:hypothetical protein
MRIQSLLVLLATLLVAGTASAKICKTVGPDGTVTYTDRPADACDAEAQAQAQAAKAGAPAPGTKPVIRKEGAPSETPPAPATPTPPVTSAETAVVGILGIEDLVQRSYDFCIGVLPTSAVRYGNAADGWRDRNMAATSKMRRALLQTFSGPQQKSMMEGVKARNQRQLSSVVSAPKDAQIKWCDQTASEIESKALDIKDTLLAPLATY